MTCNFLSKKKESKFYDCDITDSCFNYFEIADYLFEHVMKNEKWKMKNKNYFKVVEINITT